VNLAEIQKTFFEMTRQPLTPAERMRSHTTDGRSSREIAEKVIKPNDQLTAFERLEIYNRQYWFRILSSLAEDFAGLRAIIGERAFDKLSHAYLLECPSKSFTLRDLGSRLPEWLPKHLEFIPKGLERVSLDMARLEWADIEAYDLPELPRLTEADFRTMGEDPVLHLQPHMRLLELAYPVNELLLSVRDLEGQTDIVSNAVAERTRRSRMRRSALPKPQKVNLVVYRLDNTVYFKRLERDAFALIRALGEGKPLSYAIEASVNWSGQPIGRVTEQVHDWFANWSALGWFGKSAE
jgi:hypothetical protein